jgi:glycosyltransferase involved in cell wall biosynthesis
MGIIYAVLYFAQGIYLANRLEADAIELLHIHFVNSGVFVGGCAAHFLDIPWGASVHGRSDFDYPGIETMRWVIKEGKFLRCISQYGAAQAKRSVSRQYWDKIFTCYSGIPKRIISRELPDFRAADKKNILSVGRLSPEKGQFSLVDLAERLREYQTEILVTVVGEGPDKIPLENEVKQKGLSSSFEFLGALSEPEVITAMKHADIYVCPSFMEGLPQVLLEAMAVGLPVVAPYLSGIPEVVKPGETGLLYPAGDVEMMAEAVRTLCNQPDRAQTLRANAWHLMHERFTLSETIVPLKARVMSILSKSAHHHI